jgi:predicted AAA+ superfamily ATPase
LHLRRQTKDIYYFKEKQEVDFYAKINTDAYLVNVSYKIDDPLTRKREIDGLVEAMHYFNLSESYLVTSEEDQIIEIENKRIFIIPLFKWLLEIF